MVQLATGNKTQVGRKANGKSQSSTFERVCWLLADGGDARTHILCTWCNRHGGFEADVLPHSGRSGAR